MAEQIILLTKIFVQNHIFIKLIKLEYLGFKQIRLHHSTMSLSESCADNVRCRRSCSHGLFIPTSSWGSTSPWETAPEISLMLLYEKTPPCLYIASLEIKYFEKKIMKIIITVRLSRDRIPKYPVCCPR